MSTRKDDKLQFDEGDESMSQEGAGSIEGLFVPLLIFVIITIVVFGIPIIAHVIGNWKRREQK